MQRIADPPIIRAAARLFHEHPDLSNAEALRRLAGRLGSDLVLRIPINRFERQVREPALQLLREIGPEAAGRIEAEPRPSSANGSGAQPRNRTVGSAEASPPVARQARGRAPGQPEPESGPSPRPSAQTPRPSHEPAHTPSPRVSNAVDEAIVEAFSLGAVADSPNDVVTSFRDLGRLRRRIGELLDGGG